VKPRNGIDQQVHHQGRGDVLDSALPDPVRDADPGARLQGKRDAEAFLATTEVKKMTGDYVPHRAGKITVGELAEEWLVRKQQAVKANTYLVYESLWRLRIAPRWAATPVSAVDVIGIESWIAALLREGRSAARVRKAAIVLSMILDDAVKSKRLASNPSKSVGNRPRETAKKHIYLTAEDVNRLVAEAGEYGA
jgi:hypothetical protein